MVMEAYLCNTTTKQPSEHYSVNNTDIQMGNKNMLVIKICFTADCTECIIKVNCLNKISIIYYIIYYHYSAG